MRRRLLMIGLVATLGVQLASYAAEVSPQKAQMPPTADAKPKPKPVSPDTAATMTAIALAESHGEQREQPKQSGSISNKANTAVKGAHKEKRPPKADAKSPPRR